MMITLSNIFWGTIMMNTIQTQLYYADWLKDLKNLLAIPSVRDDALATIDAPYGPGPKAALDFMMAIAERDGFENIGTVGNRAGSIYVGPENDTQPIGVIVHVDVVPVNDLDQWQTDPFTPTVKTDNHLYARGADDMKSAVMLTYYAIKAIQDAKIPLKHQIRFIIGTDEESEWADMHQYFAEEGPLHYGFSPDGSANLSYGEKGISQLDLYFDSSNNADNPVQLLNFHSGTATNVLPGFATATVAGIEVDTLQPLYNHYLKTVNLSGNISAVDDFVTLNLQGVATHAARPETGKNAATYLAHFLNNFDFSSNATKFLQFIGQTLHEDPFGEKSGYGKAEPKLGKTSQNIGITDFVATKTGHINLNFRYSLAFNEPKTVEQILQDEPWLSKITRDPAGLTPHYVSQDNKLVTLLAQAYQSITGELPKQGINGGASFGRLMPNGVGFGIIPTSEPSLAHQANESFNLDNYDTGMHLLIAEILALADNL